MGGLYNVIAKVDKAVLTTMIRLEFDAVRRHHCDLTSYDSRTAVQPPAKSTGEDYRAPRANTHSTK